MRAVIFISFLAMLVRAVFWDGPVPHFPPGVLVPYEPDQETFEPQHQWQFKGSQITALANFRVRARVLLVGHYWMGRDAALSPWTSPLGGD